MVRYPPGRLRTAPCAPDAGGPLRGITYGDRVLTSLVASSLFPHDEIRTKGIGMSTDIESGIPGVTLQEGDHVCAFFSKPEDRDELITSFLRAGIAQGDHCVCVTEEPNPAHEVFRSAGETIAFLESRDAYLNSGRVGSSRAPEELGGGRADGAIRRTRPDTGDR